MSIITSETGSSPSRIHRPLSELNVIDSFLFMTLLSREDTQHEVCDLIMTEILGREFRSAGIRAEHVLTANDTNLHGIRLDAYFYENGVGDIVYDMEPDNNDSDKQALPRRNRYYSGLIDTRQLKSGDPYSSLPELVIIMILSYDPFGAGDMYYEASTNLFTHDDLSYNDGVRRIYLYADGRNNLESLKKRGIQVISVKFL